MRVKPGQHLSQAGVDLARAVGHDLGTFDRVITSNIPRAFETAIAMGFAVNEQREELGSLPDGFEDEVRWDEGFSRYAEVVRENPKGIVARFAWKLAELHQEITSGLPDNGRALVISHGGIVEASAVGCKPYENYSSWGPACDYCEGVRLFFHGNFCEKVELLRVRGPGSGTT
jgi:broad specificity phosphatase PhoE